MHALTPTCAVYYVVLLLFNYLQMYIVNILIITPAQLTIRIIIYLYILLTVPWRTW